MKVVTREEGSRVVLEPKGSLVGRATEDLSGAFQRALETERFNITIDLKTVPMVDGVGLEELLRFSEKCTSLGGACTLANASTKVKRILRVTRLDRKLTVEPDAS